MCIKTRQYMYYLKISGNIHITWLYRQTAYRHKATPYTDVISFFYFLPQDQTDDNISNYTSLQLEPSDSTISIIYQEGQHHHTEIIILKRPKLKIASHTSQTIILL